MERRCWIGIFMTIAVLVPAGSARAQQASGVQGGGAARTPTAPPPINWPSPPLADGPIVLDPNPIAGVPQVYAQRLSGLMDLALHPHFSENKLIYFTYHKPAGDNGAKGENNAGIITLARGRWDGAALTDVRDLFSAIQNANASRIVFGKDGMVYMTVGIGDPPAAARAQDPNDLAGKVLRLRDDGTVPPDNPFVGRAGYRPEIYTMGHRNALGLAVQPDTGAIWECEDGPNGGDEINLLQPGKNYGWPFVSSGRFFFGPRGREFRW